MNDIGRNRLATADFRMDDEELEFVYSVLRSGRLSEGEKVRQFEETWASAIGTKYCVAFSSGSTALLGGLLAAQDIGLIRGKTILTNPSTYVGTVNAISLAGFEVEFVDVESGSFGALAIDQLRAVLDGDTRRRIAAVMPVHLFGMPERIADMVEIGRDSDRPILEDAAEAHGSKTAGRNVGAWGLFSAFSFYQSHTIPGIEMGAVLTNNSDLSELLRSVKDQGRRAGAQRNGENWFTSYSAGLNFKTTEINAAIALVHIRKMVEIVQRRQRNAKFLSELLTGWSDVLQLPNFPDDACPFAYPLLIKDGSVTRNGIRAFLHDSGVETRPMFPCIPLHQPAYSRLRTQYLGRLPNAEYLGCSGFYVGCHEHLTCEDMETIANSINRALESLLRVD